jgi:hypothetical protein
VTKRLSQCLHPNLPGGVHLKTLETYELIFKSIPADRMKSVIGSDLFSFAAGKIIVKIIIISVIFLSNINFH